MALLQKLEDIRVVKQNYFVLQHRFYGELAKRFPYLMNKDIAKLANKLEGELHTLLCAALKYKSVMIRLTSTGRWGNSNKTYVNVQRTEPGFYYPQSQRGRSDLYYMDLNYFITDQDDMYEYMTDEYNKPKKDRLLIALSELKKAGHQIIPEKLDVYFKFLREVMAYRPKFLCYTEARDNKNANASFFIKELQFDLRSKSMDVSMKEKEKENRSHRYSNYRHSGSGGYFQYDRSEDDILHMLDYCDLDSNSFNEDIHNRLKFFINNYKEICIKFEHEEEKKHKAYKTCLDFLKQMRVHTLPFKVLNEIIK